MRHIRFHRASAVALVLTLISAGIALADTVPADGDAVTAGNQTLIDLGERLPGEVVTHDVTFALVCGGTSHADSGQTITVQPSSYSAPLDGALAATSTTIGPVPATWTVDGESCPSPTPTLPSNGSSTVTVTMPTTPDESYIFTVLYARLGANGLSGTTAISFQADVIGNTPPALAVPDSLVVEGSMTGGAEISFVVAATDAEDDPDPTPSCAPSSGSFFPLGTTSVACLVTDLGGLSASGSFEVTVVDTTAPTLAGVPADLTLVTADPAGAALLYETPTANDVVDPDPTVSCTPASGSPVPLGATTVTCTATDASGNSAGASFAVTVVHDPVTEWVVRWAEPIGGDPASLVANHGRTVPVKAEILADGVAVTTGDVSLRIVPCGGGGEASVVPLAWTSGRWAGHLDTARLGPGCNVATAVVGGEDAGSFVLELRGPEPAKASGKSPRG